jgi:hypothetical protein
LCKKIWGVVHVDGKLVWYDRIKNLVVGIVEFVVGILKE